MSILDTFFEGFAHYWWLIVPVGAVLLFYLAVPLLTYRTLRFQSPLRFEPCNLEKHALPDEVAATFSRVQNRLAPAGFEEAGIFFTPLVMGNVRGVLMLLVNPNERDAAMAVVLYGRIEEEWKIQAAYTEFSTRFADGAVIDTNNSAQAGSFKRPSSDVVTQFRKIKNERKLYRIHQAIVERYGRGTPKDWRLDTEFRGDAAAYLADCTEKELNGAIESGSMQFDESEGVYRPTLGGAYVMTWNELWPLKWIRLAQRDRKSRRIRAELSLNDTA